MLSRDDVIRIAREEGLASHADQLARLVRPGWRLEPDRSLDPSRPGATKIGGDPDLAPDESWPRNARGIQLTFLAQVDCSCLPALEDAGWAHRGRLVRLFADHVDDPMDPGLAHALTCAPDEPLERTPAPPLPDPWPVGGPCDDWGPLERFRRLPEAAVRTEPFLTAPEASPVTAEDAYSQWAYRLRIDGGDLGGDPAA